MWCGCWWPTWGHSMTRTLRYRTGRAGACVWEGVGLICGCRCRQPMKLVLGRGSTLRRHATPTTWQPGRRTTPLLFPVLSCPVQVLLDAALRPAAEWGHPDVVQVLLAAGADPNARGKVRATTGGWRPARAQS